MSSIFLIFPLCIVCGAMVLVLSQHPSKDARLGVPTSGLAATMSFSYVISTLCPPVSYITRIHLLIFQTYIFATAELCVNYICWEIEFGRKELSSLNNANKNLLNDAHWMPRKILPPPTNVVVLPEGIHKPPEPPEGTPKEEPKPTADAPQPTAATAVKKGGSVTAELTFESKVNSTSGVASVMAPVPDTKAPKSAETGAYPDKTGKFKDVMDLLDSDEVKTFKKLRWGGGPVPIFYGMGKVTKSVKYFLSMFASKYAQCPGYM